MQPQAIETEYLTKSALWRMKLIEWMRQRGRRAPVALGVLAVGVVIVVGVGAFVLTDDELESPVLEFLPVPYMSGDENQLRKQIWMEVYQPAAESGAISEDRIGRLKSYLDSSQPVFVRELAMNLLAELVHIGVKMSDASREEVVQNFLSLLHDDEWTIRRLAVTNVQTVGLLQERRVCDAVRKMANDPRAEVANRVNRIDWTDPRNGG